MLVAVLRMCSVCRVRVDKRSMIRVVKDNQGTIAVDLSGKADGRGAYICQSNLCIDKCIKIKSLNKSFRGQVHSQVYDDIIGLKQ